VANQCECGCVALLEGQRLSHSNPL
jgi:hypothetical protein